MLSTLYFYTPCLTLRLFAVVALSAADVDCPPAALSCCVTAGCCFVLFGLPIIKFSFPHPPPSSSQRLTLFTFVSFSSNIDERPGRLVRQSRDALLDR
jgi:hypothetical protein